jgi:hypothetical protein
LVIGKANGKNLKRLTEADCLFLPVPDNKANEAGFVISVERSARARLGYWGFEWLRATRGRSVFDSAGLFRPYSAHRGLGPQKQPDVPVEMARSLLPCT